MTKRQSVCEVASRVSRRLVQRFARHSVAATLLASVVLAAGHAGAANNAAYVSQNVPATMALGQTYEVSVTMQNAGDTTWNAGNLYRLGAQSPQDNATWGVSRVELSAPVAPGESVTFNFAVTAPSSVGTYNFQWRMVQDAVEWFGAYTENIAIKDGVNDAVFVSESVPSTMTPGQSYPVSVTMQNTGNTTWTAASQYRLGSQNARDNTTWGLHRVELTNAVLPGETVTFSFNVTAPTTIGTYNFQWQMVQELVEWFGAASANVVVKDGANNAAFVSQSAPAMMVPGQPYPVSVTMQNTGTTTWTAASLYRLGSQNAQDNNTWGVNRIELPNDVAPGASVTFNFNVTAPARVGAYNFQWKMVQDYVEWFGDFSTNVAVRDGVNSALFVSQTAPNVVIPGQTYPVSVTVTNTGNTTWTTGDLYRLGSQNAQDNMIWGLHRIDLPNAVAPGASVTFNFNIVAPSAMGVYSFQWRMVQDTVEWFGDYSSNVAVKDGSNDAVFLLQSVPSSMVAGQQYPVSLTIQNTGTSTWAATSFYRLGSQNAQDNSTWGAARVELAAPVAPQASTTFNFVVTAPSTVGVYNFQWRMVQELIEWFGGYSDSVAISVQGAPPNSSNLTVTLDGVLDGETLYEGTGANLVARAQEEDPAVEVPTVQIVIDGVTVATSVNGATKLRYDWINLSLGAHAATVRAVDINGVSATITKQVNVVVDPQDVPFRAILDGFKATLASGNKPAAMAFLSEQARALYGPVFDALLADMPQIVSEWSQPRRISFDAVTAEYAVTRITDEEPSIYFISFVLDDNGNWVIDSM